MLMLSGPEVLPPTEVEVVVTDPDAMTAHLLAADLRRQDRFNVIQCAPDADSLFDCLIEHSPKILLVGTNSREAALTRLWMLRRIRNQHPGTRTIVFFGDSARDVIAELFRAGVRGVFNRAEYDLERLCRCICCVSSGQVWANSEQLGHVLDVFVETASLNVVNASGEEILTRREKDVVRLVEFGK